VGKKVRKNMLAGFSLLKKKIHQEIDWKRLLKTYLPRIEDVLNLGQFAN